MDKKRSLINYPWAMLLPLMTGTTACTSSLPPSTEIPAATNHTQKHRPTSPKKLDKMLDLAPQVEKGSAAESRGKAATPTPSNQENLPDTCFVLIDCPADEPDLADQKAKKFEKQFLQQHAPSYIYKPDEKEEPTQGQLKKPLTGKHTASPALPARKEQDDTSPQEAQVVDANLMPADINQMIQRIELGNVISEQIDQYASLPSGNKLLLPVSENGITVDQYFKGSQTLEMLQDSSDYSIQTLNYVGSDIAS